MRQVRLKARSTIAAPAGIARKNAGLRARGSQLDAGSKVGRIEEETAYLTCEGAEYGPTVRAESQFHWDIDQGRNDDKNCNECRCAVTNAEEPPDPRTLQPTEPECIKPGCDAIEDEKQPDEPGGTGGPVAERQPSVSIARKPGWTPITA